MKGITDKILAWYDAFGRDLPWRRTTDPYPIWLSEIILQQTRIAQGLSYWERFLERFPTVEALAAAPEDEVLRLWQGLGYYSRARNLHAAARQVVAMGGFPRSIEGIRSLRGVGPYTAAAIGSFAFGLPAAVVDGNVYRVLARVYGISTPVVTTEAGKQFTALAQSLLPPERPGDFNQAMMDFGALQCTPQKPLCGTCPLSGECAAFQTGRVEDFPVRKAPAAVKERWLTYIYLRCDGLTALRRRGPGDIWQGLWEPFLVEHPSADRTVPLPAWTADGTLRWVRQDVRHQLTHRLLHADLYVYEAKTPPDLGGEYRWMPETELRSHALPRLVERLLEEVVTV